MIYTRQKIRSLSIICVIKPRFNAGNVHSNCSTLFTTWIALLVILGGCTRRDTPPKLLVKTPFLELGVLDPGTHDVSIEIENNGGKTLFIDKVTSSCSCTNARFPNELSASGKGLVQASVTIGPGPGSARLSITSNDPENPHVIHFAWFGKSKPKLVPSSVRISLRPDEVTGQNIEICYAGGEVGGHLKFLKAADLPDGVTVELISENPNAIRTIPGLGASTSEAPSLIVGKTVLRLNSRESIKAPLNAIGTIIVEQRGEIYKLPLEITILPYKSLRSSPSTLMFSASSLDQLKTIKRNAIIFSEVTNGGKLRVVRKPEFLNIELLESQDSTQRTKLIARIDGDPSMGSHNGEIELADTSGSKLKIPVYIDYSK